MDRKRKSVFPSSRDNRLKLTRSKINHETHDQNTSSSQYSRLRDHESHEKHIIPGHPGDKIINNAGSSAVSFSPENTRAGANLDRITQQTTLSKSPTCASRSQITATSEVAQNNFEKLPPLPPIIDPKLEKAVFTHPGVSSDPKTTYDRLEILGDAYIELIATKLIWGKFQEISAGRISQIRELLVKNETLAEYATNYGFDRRASVPQDYLSQPKRWVKTKGDIFEAYVAAVVLSHSTGFSIVEEWLSQLWLPKLATVDTPETHLHAKELLAKKIMGKGVKLKYVDEKPPIQHERGTQTFFIGVYLTGWGWNRKHLGSGEGSSKTIAGHRAAQQALQNQSLINMIIDIKKDSKEHRV